MAALCRANRRAMKSRSLSARFVNTWSEAHDMGIPEIFLNFG